MPSQILNPARSVELGSIVPTSVTITPSDSTVVNLVGFYCGVSGNVAVQSPENGTSVVYVSVPQGSQIACRANRIMATGTTATSIVGLMA